MSEKTISIEAIDKKAATFKAEFDKGNEVLAKLNEQARSIAQQKQSTLTMMYKLQGAVRSLSEIKADITGDVPIDIPKINPETGKDGPDADETEEVTE